jgi:hypothetical protein
MVRLPRWFAISFVLAGFASVSDVVRADDIEGSLTVTGNVVKVRVSLEKGGAAADVPLRLYDSAGKIVAAGRSDAQGRWSCPLERSGKYEVEIVCGTAPDDVYRLPPVTWTAPEIPATSAVPTLACCRASALKSLPPVIPEEFPLETVALGFGCLGAAGSIFYLRRLGSPA